MTSLPITEPGIYPGISELAYHADPCIAPSLSASIAKVLVDRSPRHAWAKHPRLGAKEDSEESEEKKPTKAQLIGSLCHRLMLGAGGEVVICPFENWRKNEAKDMRHRILTEGNIPALQSQFDEATIAVNAWRSQLDDMGLDYVFRDGMKEVTVVWKEGTAYFRSKFDQLVIDEQVPSAEIWDLKTVSRSSHPEACAAQIVKMGYDLSRAFYKQGMQTVRPDLSGRIKFRWAFGELEFPYAITPVEIDGEWDTLALSHYCNAADCWRKCIESARWPFYVKQVTRLEPKPWMLAAALGATIAGND